MTTNYWFPEELESAAVGKKIKAEVTRMWDDNNIVIGKLIFLKIVLLDEHVSVAIF